MFDINGNAWELEGLLFETKMGMGLQSDIFQG